MDSGEITTAWIYMLDRWNPSLLENASDFLNNYSSTGGHGRLYVARWVAWTFIFYYASSFFVRLFLTISCYVWN